METQKEQTVTVSLRVPLSTKIKLMKEASKSYRTMSAEMEMLMNHGMKKFYKKEGSEIK